MTRKHFAFCAKSYIGVSRTTLWRMAKRQSELEQKQREQEISKRRSE
ncbi:MAG: hypothetical protein ACLUD2_19950 [Clostridium sp.]